MKVNNFRLFLKKCCIVGGIKYFVFRTLFFSEYKMYLNKYIFMLKYRSYRYLQMI